MSIEYVGTNDLIDSSKWVPSIIEDIQQQLEETIINTNDKLRKLIKSGYYHRLSITFRCQVYEAVLFYEAVLEELQTLSVIGNATVLSCMERFNQFSWTASSLNTALRFSWKTNSYPDDYPAECFLVLSDVYNDLVHMYRRIEELDMLSEWLVNNFEG